MAASHRRCSERDLCSSRLVVVRVLSVGFEGAPRKLFPLGVNFLLSSTSIALHTMCAFVRARVCVCVCGVCVSKRLCYCQCTTPSTRSGRQAVPFLYSRPPLSSLSSFPDHREIHLCTARNCSPPSLILCPFSSLASCFFRAF